MPIQPRLAQLDSIDNARVIPDSVGVECAALPHSSHQQPGSQPDGPGLYCLHQRTLAAFLSHDIKAQRGEMAC